MSYTLGFIQLIQTAQMIAANTKPISVDYKIGKTTYKTIKCDGSDDPKITFSINGGRTRWCKMSKLDTNHIGLLLQHIYETKKVH